MWIVVGDRSSIKILDKWQLTPTSYAVKPIRVLDREARVKEPMQFGHKPHRQKDQLEWIGTSRGNFSMKNAYYFEKETNIQCKGGKFKSSIHSCLRKRIWKSSAMEVVKTFLWRACNNLLLTKENFFKKWIVSYPLCLLVGWRWRLLAIFCGSVRPQKMFGLPAVEKSRNIPVMKMIFQAY